MKTWNYIEISMDFGKQKESEKNIEKRLVLDRLEHNIRKSEEDWEDIEEDCSNHENQNTVGSNFTADETMLIEIKEEVRFENNQDIIYIDSSSDGEILTKTEIVSPECQDEEELYKPEKYECHRCEAFFFTKPMLKRHEELHNEGIIYLAGQSVVPVSWIGRQTTKKKNPTPENSPIKKKAKTTVILEQQKKQLFTGEDRRSSQSRHQKRREVTVAISEPTGGCPIEEHLLNDSSRSSSSLNSPFRGTSDTVLSPSAAENQHSIPRDIGHLEYYDGDKRLPILMRDCKGVKTREALNFIINEDNLDKENISTIVPTTINQNVSFLVDTKKIGSWKNLLSDDMGTWKTTCVANRFYKWDEKGDLISTPSRQPECFIVYRHQYVNLSSPDLHRIIIRTGTSPEKMMNTVFVQYYFEDEEHAVLVLPHGNRKQDNKPYKRTQETVKTTIRELNMNKRPKDVFHTILERTGGIENLTSGSQKPRDMQQVYNLKRKESNDEILETIDLRATEEIKFIRHIEMVPEFSVFLATDNQLHEIEKYCTNNVNFSILGVDTTFNIGNFYVTLTTYRNLMLEHKTKKHEPVMIGPVLIHQQRTYDSFYMLPSFMIRTKPTLNKILVYGTDGELNLKTSFSSCLPFAHHLLCDIHMKDNIISKLTSLNIKGAVRKLYVDEIFGKQIQEILIPGLTDCISPSEFDRKLEKMTGTWIERHEKGPDFLKYFLDFKSDLIKSCMSAEIRSKCGLGYPPKPYTQNANECINRVVKSNLNCQKQTVPEFIKALKRTILRQETEIKLALTGQSDFKPKSEYSYLEVTEDRYFRMDLKQKEHVFKKFQNANLKSRHHEEDEGMFIDDTDHSGALTVTADGSGITSVPFPILKGIFEKAATLYHSQSDIVSFPGKPGAANIIGKYFITSSTDAAKPHLVTVLYTGQVTCDSNCPRWEMYKVCSHSIAAAEHCNLLEKFVKWFKTKTISLNLTGLANLNMPCGRGKKPHKATQKRKGKANKRNETALTYLDEHDQPQVPPPRPPDGGYVIYFLKDCDNKVSKCYGCKGNLKHEGQIPQPPGDLVVVSRGRREYFKDGTKLYGEINNIYFHLSEQCIKSKNTFFVPSLVYVAPYVASQFQQKHKDLLDQCSVTYNI